MNRFVILPPGVVSKNRGGAETTLANNSVNIDLNKENAKNQSIARSDSLCDTYLEALREPKYTTTVDNSTTTALPAPIIAYPRR